MGLFVHGMIIGGLTALIALGMALIYRSNRILNFAQADLGVAAGGLHGDAHDGVGVAVAGGGARRSSPAALLLGAVSSSAIIRRFAKAPRLLLMVATIGLSQVLAAPAILLPGLFGRSTIDTVSVPAPFEMDWTVGGFHFGTEAFLAIIAIPVAAASPSAGSCGAAASAWPSGPRPTARGRATSLGVPVKRLQTIVWSLAALLSFVAVYLRAGMLPGSAATTLSFAVLLRSLAALLIGRLTDLVTIATTAVALGVLEIGVGQNAESPDVIDPILAGVILVALVARRKGSTRVDIADSSSWQSVEDVRPIPTSLARLPSCAWRGGVGLFLLAAFTLVLPHLLSVDRIFKASSLIAFAVLGALGRGAHRVVGPGVARPDGLRRHRRHRRGQGHRRLGARPHPRVRPVTAAVGAVVAVVVGLPALRLRGIYLAVTTLAFSLAITVYF